MSRCEILHAHKYKADFTLIYMPVKGMVVESEVLKAQNCALSKFSLPVHCNGDSRRDIRTSLISTYCIFNRQNFDLNKFWLMDPN